jgi:hypothetical protein
MIGLASLALNLAPTAYNVAKSIFSSGKEKEAEQERSKLKGIADVAMQSFQSQLGPPPVALRETGELFKRHYSDVSNTFQQSMNQYGNPVMAGLDAARAAYRAAPSLKDDLMSKAKGIGGWVKGIFGKLWENKGEIANAVGDYMMKRPRLA